MGAVRVSAFRWVPPFAQGLVRDLRVRWALEEAGRPYDEQLIGREDQASADYRRLQPFGQVPAFEEEDGLVLFESGAIVLHVAEGSDALMPTEPAARARTKTWMFAALNTIEPPIIVLNVVEQIAAGAETGKPFRDATEQVIAKRLAGLAAYLGDNEYLVDRFSAADLLMTTVLRILRDSELVAREPRLEAYRLRCQARPAFERALDAQMAAFARHAPPSP
jgi:glutathione S-transferase